MRTRRDKNLPKAVAILQALLPDNAISNNNAVNYVQFQNGDAESTNHAKAAAALANATAKVKAETAKVAATKRASDAKPKDQNLKTALAKTQQELAAAISAENAARAAHTQAEKQLAAKNQAIAAPLLAAIPKNPQQAHFLRYTLAFYVYRDRMKDVAKMRQAFRDLVTQSPSDDGNTSTAIHTLLTTATTDAEFQQDVAAVVDSAKNHLHVTTLRTSLAGWANGYRRHKTLKQRAAIVQQQVKALNGSDLVQTWLLAVSNNRKAEAPRAKWRQPAVVKAMSDDMARVLLSAQGYFYWHYTSNKERQNAALVYAQLAKRFPKDYAAAFNYLQTATDYNPLEIRKEATLHLLTFDPTSNHPDAWRRMLGVADAAKDTSLVKRIYTWLTKSQATHGGSSEYASYIGDVLLKHKLETEAVAYWTKAVALDRNHYESRMRLAADRADARRRHRRRRQENAAAGPQQTHRLRSELFKHDTDYHGQYASWLADMYLAKKDLASFESILETGPSTAGRAAVPRLGSSRNTAAQNWINAFRGNKDKPDAEQVRVFSIIRDLDIGRSSATALLSLLEIAPPKAEIQRLLQYQSATRIVDDSSHDWDRLMPHVQARWPAKTSRLPPRCSPGCWPTFRASTRLGRRRAANSSRKVTPAWGPSVSRSMNPVPSHRCAGRVVPAAGGHAVRFGNLHGEQSVVQQAPQPGSRRSAAVRLRQPHRRRGDKNHEYVEDLLRGWMVKNSESKAIEESTKARVQLLLARNFFKARRYDIARSEFNTVINRYAKTKQAVEAQFGIGETYMAQKVYVQAEAVFDKLAASRDADVIVRAEFLRGVLAYRRGDKDKAREIFRGVLERVPDVSLADQALFNLAEVYGSEERYIDQLNLLRTVGRLGRSPPNDHPSVPKSPK